MRRSVERLQRVHGEQRAAEGEPALLPRSGLSPGRTAARAIRRDHADYRAHEHRGASDVSLQGHVYLDLRQFPDHGERCRAAAYVPAGDRGVGVDLFRCRPREGGGPITTKVSVIAGLTTSSCCGVWVPAFAGTAATSSTDTNDQRSSATRW